MRKRFLFFGICIIITLMGILPASAQTVSYSHRILSEEGCIMSYSIAKQENDFYIIASSESDNLLFLQKPSFWLKTFDGDVIKLQGEAIGNGSESIGIVSGNIVIPVTEIISSAQFKISEEEIELLKKGISKVRLSMSPVDHEREFKKDRIGKKLYQFYLNKKKQDDEF